MRNRAASGDKSGHLRIWIVAYLLVKCSQIFGRANFPVRVTIGTSTFSNTMGSCDA